jgi:hypothetical protein
VRPDRRPLIHPLRKRALGRGGQAMAAYDLTEPREIRRAAVDVGERSLPTSIRARAGDLGIVRGSIRSLGH